MPIKIQTQKVPAKAILEKKRAASKASTSEKKSGKKASIRKRAEEYEATLFGSQLFEPITKRGKEIVIVFTRFTLDRTRFSTCGRFAFRPSGEFFFDLFYCLDLIKDFSDDFVISPNNRIKLFHRVTVEELENWCIKLINAEFAEDKKLELEKIFEEEKRIWEERRLEEEKMDSEYEEELEKEFEGLIATDKILTNEVEKDEPINISTATKNSNVQMETVDDQQTYKEINEKVEETRNPFKSLFSKSI